MAELEKSINELSDEELKALLDRLSSGKDDKPGETKTTTNEKVKVTLSDGSVIEGDTQEDVNRQLAARLEEARNSQTTAPQVAAPQNTKPEWNYDEFTKKFLKDPRDGMDYLDTVENGFSTRKAVPVLMNLVAALAKKTQDLETQRFMQENGSEVVTPQNRKIVENIVQERGWQPGYQSFQDAFDIAKSRGMITIAEKEAAENTSSAQKNFVPPRVRSKAQETSNEDFLRSADRLSDEKLEDLLVEAGMIKARRFSQ